MAFKFQHFWTFAVLLKHLACLSPLSKYETIANYYFLLGEVFLKRGNFPHKIDPVTAFCHLARYSGKSFFIATSATQDLIRIEKNSIFSSDTFSMRGFGLLFWKKRRHHTVKLLSDPHLIHDKIFFCPRHQIAEEIASATETEVTRPTTASSDTPPSTAHKLSSTTPPLGLRRISQEVNSAGKHEMSGWLSWLSLGYSFTLFDLPVLLQETFLSIYISLSFFPSTDPEVIPNPMAVQKCEQREPLWAVQDRLKM